MIKLPRIVRAFIPVQVGSPEAYFPELKEALKETLRKKLKEEYAKRSKDGFRAPEGKSGTHITKEQFEKFNGEWEKEFDASVSLSFEKNVKGYTGGREHRSDKVTVEVQSDFAKRCNFYGVEIGNDLQPAAVEFFKGKGFNPKEFKPMVSSRVVAPA